MDAPVTAQATAPASAPANTLNPAKLDALLTRAVADAVPVPVIASGGVGTLEHLAEGVLEGHASAVLAGAADRVEVVLLGNGKLYSRAQATYVLEAFFREHPPASFGLDHSSNAEESWFASGVYEVKQGDRPFQVYLRLRQRGEQWELREIRIEQRKR